MSETRVLVVEDESIVQLHLRKILTQLGYAVSDVVATGEEALASVEAACPDLVLMDIRLAGALDGVETARDLRTRFDLPVIFLTAYADEKTLDRTREIEPAGYVVKPFTAEDIRAAITTALAKDRAIRRIRDNERWLATILESIGDGLIVSDPEGRVTYLSRVAEELIGWSAPEALDRRLDELAAARVGDSERPFSGMGESVQRTGERLRLPDALVRGRGGRERPVDITAAALVTDDGTRAGMVLVLRDISERKRAQREVADLRQLLAEGTHFHGLIGRSPAMERVFQHVREVAPVDWTVLIEGETGTGKELIARAIHAEGPRRARPFVPVNTAGLTESLLASQLFGHRKGAFTGAVADQKGVFEAAEGGTLFLDEIGDVPLPIQTSLLRVLEERTVTLLGSAQPKKIDVRFIAATHRDLAAEVAAGRFRADLVYRIRVARIELPPLRDRGEDVELLALKFLDRAAAASGKQVHEIAPDAWAAMRSCLWPGNVRELKSAIEYAIIHARGPVLQESDLPPEVRSGRPSGQEPDGEREAILDALRRSDGNRSRAARVLGISRATFYRRLTELNIEIEDHL